MEPETGVSAQYDLAVDFMDMTDARRLWTRRSDARPGFEAVVGGYAIVGDDDADPRVARIIDIDEDGIIELEVLDGTVDAPRPRHPARSNQRRAKISGRAPPSAVIRCASPVVP